MADSTTTTKTGRIFIQIIAVGLLFFVTVLIVGYLQKDKLVNEALNQINESFEGKVVIGKARLSPFANFPYISIDLRNVEVHETKDLASDTILFLEDAYIGFGVISLLSGNIEIKKIKLENGFLRMVQFADGSLNVTKAFATTDTLSTMDQPTDDQLNLTLDAIELKNIDLWKYNQSTDILVEAFIENATSSFSSINDHIKASLESRFLFHLMMNGDTSFIHNKHVSLRTALDYDLDKQLLTLNRSTISIEKAQFMMEGNIDIKNDLDLALSFKGEKPNFDLFLAFVPAELAPLVDRYDNGGNVYFDALIKGPSINGFTPHIDLNFGCSEAFVQNTQMDKEVNQLQFKGHFTNGADNSAATSKLMIQDFRARPETGSLEGALTIQNFDTPDIDMQIDADFNLDFLTSFLNLDQLEDVSGKVQLQMNFHDIIDLDDPGKAIERLNESYYTSLSVSNLNFTSPSFHLPFRDINIEAFMDGHEATIKKFTAKAGASDVSLSASISDLPAILHHTKLPIAVNLQLNAQFLDLAEFTQATDTSGFDEKIKNLSLGLRFNSSARAFTESPNLPLGEFFITDLTADMSNYPHTLHDFDADVIIDSVDFKVIDFTGMIDKSDFHFNGKLRNYDLWFEPEPKGVTVVDFNLTSDQLQLSDLFSYGGENFVPKDYRSEVFEKLKIHAITTLDFEGKLTSANLAVDKIEANLKEHQMSFERFGGNFYMDSLRFEVTDFGGKLGNSIFNADLKYARKSNATTPPHSFRFESSQLDFDQLFSYIPATPSDTNKIDHNAAFNVFDLPFANLEMELLVDKMNYHRYLLDQVTFKGSMQEDHYIYIDTLSLLTAGGKVAMKGYFNGSDPTSIYFSPTIALEKMNLDQLLFKFENFGQDAMVSDNLQGDLSGIVKGKIKMYPDLIPIIDDSELEMDISVYDGAIKNFAAFDAMATYFTDKNLSYVRFDTLKNKLTLRNGALEIPNMILNTSVGYFQIAGKQYIDQRMDYTIRIPMKVIAKAGAQKLFGKKELDTSEQIDAIEYKDKTKRTRYVNLQVKGTPDDFEISLGKD